MAFYMHFGRVRLARCCDKMHCCHLFFPYGGLAKTLAYEIQRIPAGGELLVVASQWIALFARSGWLLKLRIMFAFHLPALPGLHARDFQAKKARNKVIQKPNIFRRIFFEPHYESKASCMVSIMKTSFHSCTNQTNFRMKSLAKRLAVS